MLSADERLVLEVPCETKGDEYVLQVRALREGPENYAINPEKIRDLWAEARKFDVLFSDYTSGKLEPFLDILMDPRGAWWEITKDGPDEIVGAMYATNVVPGFDAEGHFTFWDSVASGRDALVMFMAEYVMDRYQLQRLTAKVPVYQKGTIRFIKRTGFVEEGELRQAVLHKGKWLPMGIYGLIREDLEKKLQEVW